MPFRIVSPYSGETNTSVAANTKEEVNKAVETASKATLQWANTSSEKRETILKQYAELVRSNADQIAKCISDEVGKPAWEAATEVTTMAGKIQLSIDAYHQRCSAFGNGDARTRFKAHGVMAVFGPFNFPCHLPNGHIIPALLAGNTVVFKPSEKTPRSSSWIVQLLLEAGLPEGTIQLVQGLKETGEAVANHARIDALAFTGSAQTGEFLGKTFAENPGKMLALELGGNNPLVVWGKNDLNAAALTILQSAFITAGQRCTCARRLIIGKDGASDQILKLVCEKAATLRVGPPDCSPPPFCGPVINEEVALQLLKAQEQLVSQGAQILAPLKQLKPGTGLLQPGILDVTDVKKREDSEFFGPLLQVIRVDSFEEAIEEANNTRFGLVSGLLSNEEDLYREFYSKARAGLINWNYPLPGASGAAPFGGIGRSGNLRPSGFFAADYCSYPVASMEKSTLSFPETPLPGLW